MGILVIKLVSVRITIHKIKQIEGARLDLGTWHYPIERAHALLPGRWHADQRASGLGIIDLKTQNTVLLKFFDKFCNNADFPWVQLT